jgi:hypothetical protein
MAPRSHMLTQIFIDQQLDQQKQINFALYKYLQLKLLTWHHLYQLLSQVSISVLSSTDSDLYHQVQIAICTIKYR